MENRMARSYWQIILFIAIVILALNAFALWQVIGSKTLTDIVTGQYRGFVGIPYNPLPDILRTTLVILFFLALLIWSALSVWNKVNSQHAVKRIATFITSIIIAGLASIASYFIDGTWVSAFRDSPAFGFPISPFVFTNAILVFGIITLFVASMMIRALRINQQ